MTPEELRKVLQQPASLEAIRAAAASGDLANILPTRFFDHIADVYARLERIVSASPEAWPLKLVVLVHEEPPARAAELVSCVGFPDVSDLVFHILSGFGAVWKVRNDAQLELYVRAHRADLASLLLFELAHEGIPTASMRSAARAAGLVVEFQRWITMLTPQRRASVAAGRSSLGGCTGR